MTEGVNCRLQLQVAGAGASCRLQVQVAGAGCRLRVAGCRLWVAGLFCWTRLLVRVVSWVIQFHQVCSAAFRFCMYVAFRFKRTSV